MSGKRKVQGEIMKRQLTGKAPTLKKMAHYQALTEKTEKVREALYAARGEKIAAKEEADLLGSDVHGRLETATGKERDANARTDRANWRLYNDGQKLKAELGGDYAGQFASEDDAYDSEGEARYPKLKAKFAWDDYVQRDLDRTEFGLWAQENGEFIEWANGWGLET